MTVDEAAPGAREPGAKVHPLSPNQLTIWLRQAIEPASVAFHMTFATRVLGALDPVALRWATDQIVLRHGALRTTFHAHGDRVVQVEHATASADFDYVDAEDWAQEAVDARVRSEGLRPFDLEHGPLARFVVLRRSAGEHVVVTTHHHIVSDMWTQVVLHAEWLKLYEQHVTGVDANLPRLRASLGDHARAVIAAGETEQALEDRAYWTGLLAGAPPLDLPTDLVPTDRPTGEGAMHTFRVDAATSAALRQVATDHGTTPFAVGLASFAALLRRITSTTDLVIGVPKAGRTHRTANIVGYFVNPLTWRFDLDGDPSFADVITKVRTTMAESAPHERYPMQSIVDALRESRSAPSAGGSRVTFLWQKTSRMLGPDFAPALAVGWPGARAEAHGLVIESIAQERRASPSDLSLLVGEIGDELVAAIEYRRDLFSPELVASIADAWRALLSAAVHEPELPISELPLLSPEAAAQLEHEWAASAAPFDETATMHGLFERQAHASPDHVAVLFGGQQVTYRALNERANRLATHLRSLGVAPGSFVGLHLERSIEMVVSVLAVLKAGGTYVPLDPEYPADRLAFMIEDCGVELVLLDSLPGSVHGVDALWPGVRCVALDAEAAHIATLDDRDLEGGASASDLAYVIFTSGSSGRPKGVAVEHRSVVNLLVGLARRIPINADDTVLAAASLSFDVSVSDLFYPLVSGARVAVAARDTVLDARALRSLLRDAGVTMMEATPTTWRMLLEDGWQGDPALTVVCGAELMAPDLAHALLARSREVWNSYGPTETTVTTTMHRVEPRSGAVPIGTALANTRLYVLDAAGSLLPAGVPGELYIGGECLARGYLGRDTLTAERFVPDPFRGVAGARMYRTGDLVRRRADGVLEYLGRLDTQVKVRGYRIELGEIESVLARHESVRDVVVAARSFGSGDVRLVAYVIAHDGFDAAVLRRHVATSLPAHMVPVAFVRVDAFPLMPNKKIDRGALPLPSEPDTVVRASAPPHAGVETDLAAIWCDVLGIAQVGRDDNFFELGGHSLLAARIVSRVRRTFSIEVPLRGVFDHPTIASFAPLMGATEQRASNASPVRVVERRESHPLSHSQERMWFLFQLHPESAAYNLPGAIRLRGELDIEALREACNDLVARHESLRTSFAMVDGAPRQLIADHLTVPMPLFDHRALDPAQRDAALTQQLQADAQRPFALDQLPLVAVALHRMADDEHVLFLNMHHIVSDHWSFGVLGAEVAEYYAARVAGRPSERAPMLIQHVDYIRWHEDWLDSGVLREQLAYWRTQLADLPVLDLPADRPRPLVQTNNGAIVVSDIPPEVIAGLRELGPQLNASPFAIMLAAFDVLLHRYTGARDIVVGTAIANRTFLESEELISSFVNTLVMRSDLTNDPTFAALVRRVQSTAHDAYANQDVPFARLVEELQPTRDLSRSPFFQVFFNMQNALSRPPSLGGLELEIVPIDRGSSQFDLSMSVDLDVDRAVTAEYNTDLFDRDRIERLIGHYWTVLAAALADPSCPISALPVATAAERDDERARWAATVVPIDESATVHGRFEAQVRATPDRVAVQFADAALTYAELDARANQLAVQLRSSGVAPGSFVGVHLERSLEMVVGVLAVLKAGAAYLPLDPAFPADRLEFMVADSGTQVVLVAASTATDRAPQWPGITFVTVDHTEPAAETTDRATAAQALALGGAGARDLAYVIYTSGSTGRPKGVELEHRSVVNFLDAMRSTLDVTADDVLLSVTTLSFDISVLELFVPLTTGAKVVVASRDTVVDATRLRDELATTGATIVQATPTTWRMLVEDGWEGDRDLTVVCGGEAMSRDLADVLLARCATLWNAYGPTETTVWSAMHRVEPGSGAVPIGSAIANTRLYVLDATGALLPVGVPGELFIGGDGLARGYLGREALTAERFLPDPYADEAGARMYRTGDLVRRRADGVLEYLGRLDTQVKVRGYRIELGEIESVLARHPSVRDVVVAAREFGAGDVRLLAYVIADDVIDPAALRAHAQIDLPSYMVPVAFVQVDAFPLTPNNKIDRDALALPASLEVVRGSASSSEPPLPGLESDVAAIWCDVLGISHVGRHDNFFELGGHSLLAVRVFAQLQELTGCALPLTSLFRAPTIAGIVELVRDQGWTPRFTSLVEVKPDGEEQPFFHVAPFLITALSFSNLAHAFDDDHPLYAFQPQGLEDEQDIHASVRDMAAHYIDEMKQVQPTGPYAIGGHCAGSWVAFEMAQQLQANGDEVNALVLIDAEPPNIEPPRIGRARYIAQRLVYYARSGRLRDSLRWKVGLAWQHLMLRRIGTPGQRRAATVRAAHAAAYSTYRSDMVKGDVLFVRSSESATLSDKDWHLRWNELITGELTTVVVPGSHAALVEEEPSRAVAEVIGNVLAGRSTR